MDQEMQVLQQIAELFQAARELLTVPSAALSSEAAAKESAAGAELPARLVNVALYRSGRPRNSTSGRGQTLVEAVRTAMLFIRAEEHAQLPLSSAELAETRLEIWIYLNGEPLAGPDALDLGLDGLELQYEEHVAYYLPSVALTSNLKNGTQFLGKLTRKAGLAADAWRSENARVRRSRWLHVVELPQEEPGFLFLSRLRPLGDPPVTPADIEEAASATLDHLLATQDAQGYYLYSYHPFKGLSSASTGPGSLIRQAGCAYAMAWASAHERDEARARTLAASAARTIAFLLGFAQPLPTGGLVIQEPDGQSPSGKLGTIGLLLLAMQHPPLLQQYQRERRELVRAILSQQEAEGAFRPHTNSSLISHEDTRQNYYPGEALLALCYEARHVDGEDVRVCLEAIERAFPWYYAHFEQVPATAFLLWQVDVWRLHVEQCLKGAGVLLDPQRCADFVFRMVDWVLPFQVDGTTMHADYSGGFVPAGLTRPAISSAAFTEAVIRAYGLAARLGLEQRAERYRRAALAGLRFLLRLQISPLTSFLFEHPELALGGITQSLGNFALRCDFDQHTITAFLAALETPGLLDETN